MSSIEDRQDKETIGEAFGWEDTESYRDMIWRIKLGEVSEPKYQVSQDTNGKVVKAFFVGRNYELQELLNK